MRNIRAALAVVVLVVVLAGCFPQAPGPEVPEPSAAPTETQAEETEPSAALPADAVLVVKALATADTGAALQLTLVVHQSVASSDDTGARQLLLDACSGGLDGALLDENLWSTTTIDVSAESTTDAAWPGDHRIGVLPFATYVDIAAEGAVLDDAEVSDDTPGCRRDKVLFGAGDGTIWMGLHGDTDGAGAAGNFTRWANHNYGFTGVRVSGQSAADSGITISDCAYEVTDAGLALNGDAEWWGSRINDSHCVIGSLTEEEDF
jgi:hypothetical protein